MTRTSDQWTSGDITKKCGSQDEPRDLKRKHVRIVTEHGTSVPLADVYPDKVRGSKLKKVKGKTKRH